MDNPRRNIEDLRGDINKMPKFDGNTKFYDFSELVSKNHNETEMERKDSERRTFVNNPSSDTFGATTLGEPARQRESQFAGVKGASIPDTANHDIAKKQVQERLARMAAERKADNIKTFKKVAAVALAGTLAVTAVFGASQIYKALNNQVPEASYGVIYNDPNGHTSFDSTNELDIYCEENGIDKASLEYHVDSSGSVDVSNTSLGITSEKTR